MASGGTQPAGFGFQCLNFQVDKLKKNQNPGVAPPDGAILFYWPKRVCRKGPALRWACLTRDDGHFKSERSRRLNAYTSPAGAEALVSLSDSAWLWFCGDPVPCAAAGSEWMKDD
jgi:hypothetical protein